jgi:hypothetical protein
VRCTAFQAAGGFSSLTGAEDYHLWLRLAGMGWAVANCPKDLVVYSPGCAGLSRQLARVLPAELACLTDVAEQFAVPDQEKLRRLVSLHLDHCRGAIHNRDLRLVRSFALKSLRLSISARQIAVLAVASAPRAELDLVRKSTAR